MPIEFNLKKSKVISHILKTFQNIFENHKLILKVHWTWTMFMHVVRKENQVQPAFAVVGFISEGQYFIDSGEVAGSTFIVAKSWWWSANSQSHEMKGWEWMAITNTRHVDGKDLGASQRFDISQCGILSFSSGLPRSETATSATSLFTWSGHFTAGVVSEKSETPSWSISYIAN